MPVSPITLSQGSVGGAGSGVPTKLGGAFSGENSGPGIAGTAPGAFTGIVPVQMHANTPITTPPPEPEDPEIGSRWGKASAFELPAQNSDTTTTGQTPPPVYVKNSPKHKRETRVEVIPKYEDENHTVEKYICPSYSNGTEPNSPMRNVSFDAYFWNSIQIPLGSEQVKEIAGFTAYPDGHVQERYKNVEITRKLTMTFSYFPMFPQATGELSEDITLTGSSED